MAVQITQNTCRRCIYIWLGLMVCNIGYFFMPFPPFVMRAALMLFMLWTIIMNSRRGFALSDKLILIFVALQWLYCLVINFSPTVAYTSCVNTSVALLSFVFMSVMAQRGVVGHKFITLFIILLTIVSVLAYYNAEALLMQRWHRKAGEVTVNASARFVMLLPTLFFVKSKRIGIACLCVAIFFILVSIKRGNILAASVPTLLYVYTTLRNSKLKVWHKVVILLLFGVMTIYMMDVYESNDYIQSRIEKTKQGKTSGRDLIYPEMWRLWAEKSTPVQFIFGYGFNGTMLNSSMHKLAHNDWLELLVDNGFVGASLYLMILLSIIMLFRRLPSGNIQYALISFVIIWLIKSLVSMGFTDDSLALMALPYGIAVASVRERCNRDKLVRPCRIAAVKSI